MCIRDSAYTPHVLATRVRREVWLICPLVLNQCVRREHRPRTRIRLETCQIREDKWITDDGREVDVRGGTQSYIQSAGKQHYNRHIVMYTRYVYS